MDSLLRPFPTAGQKPTVSKVFDMLSCLNNWKRGLKWLGSNGL